MPNIHPSGELIEEVGGSIEGGPTVVMHDPAELRTVAGLCALAYHSDAPMHALYGLLNSRELIRVPEVPQSRNSHWSEPEPGDLEHPARSLMIASSYIEDLWRNTRDKEEMTCVLTIARPERDMRLDMDLDKPGLIIHSGSLIATLVSGPLTVFGWSIGLFSGRGVAASTRAKRIVEEFRTRALNRPGTQPVERLDNLPPDYLRAKRAVIVLMHGLLSIDVGLFDALVQQLRSDAAFEDCAIVGWPHNTLAGIRENAVELLPLFARAIGIDGPDVAFVCHSRGGLLARAVAVELGEANPAWLPKVKACVTFGTPHEGAPLAEAPGDLMGKLVAVQAFRGGDGFLSLGDALHFVHQQTSIQGILDLRPIGGGGDFLQDLLRREARSAPPGAERSLPVLAIGGRANDRGVLAELSRRALAGTDNDLIVETSSAATRYSVRSLVTECNHFEYFRNVQAQEDSFAQARTFLKEQLELDAEAALANRVVLETQTDVTVNPIRLKKRHSTYTAAKPATS